MVGQHHEAAVELPFFAGENSLHDGLEIVVDHALGYAAEVRIPTKAATYSNLIAATLPT